MTYMRSYAQQECEEWLRERNRQKPDGVPDPHSERINYPREPHGIYYLAHTIASTMTYRQPALLWITEWGVWPSSENWHLYYKLRETYGDRRLLHEAPGHFFLDYETEDLASFLQLAMLNGWGGYVLTQADYVNAFFSHDEYVDFFANHKENLGVVRTELRTFISPLPAE
ncbi:MAG TPA: hypothetical protein VKR82_12845 [Candidatus Acidoferrales bacterium]|nr:hypothetical protein [Candidatus Acidoferrales bacterium]